MHYDLHIHSCLSPCADDDMTPNNICNMAVIKGLDVIAVTDHNSTRQLPAIEKVASQVGIKLLFGAEIQTREEVHVLCLFPLLSNALQFQEWIDSKMPDIPNRPGYFGNQLIMNEHDQIIGSEDRLLLVSLSASIGECASAIHSCHGLCIPAHVTDRVNSIMTQLGFIPEDLDFDGLEIKNDKQRNLIIKAHPWLKNKHFFWLCDSDAHHLVDISEACHELNMSELVRSAGDST